MNRKLRKFYDMVEQIEIAMMTTRRPDGHLVSRPMATQDRAPGADLWFVTSEDTEKLDELESDPHVNLAYYNQSTREWVSVSGRAKLSRDAKTKRKLYDASWKVWFPEKDEARDGSADDPRILLIGVDIHSVFYLEVDKPRPVLLFEVAKGFLTGSQPDWGQMVKITPGDLRPKKKSKRAGSRKAGTKKASGTNETGKKKAATKTKSDATKKSKSTKSASTKRSAAKKSSKKKSGTSRKSSKRKSSKK